MLIQLLIARPQMLGTVVAHTPLWVWGLLAVLVAVGLSQLKTRSASLARVALLPIGMSALSLWGTLSAFGHSPQLGAVLMAWVATSAAALAATAPFAPPAGTRFDAATRRFTLPGSWIPMLLVLGVFLTKYVVGVDTAMQPQLAVDGRYTLAVGTLYGLFSGIFLGRAARLWRLAARGVSPARALGINA